MQMNNIVALWGINCSYVNKFEFYLYYLIHQLKSLLGQMEILISSMTLFSF